MMKLSEIRKAYEDATDTLSNLNRQLCFAGFAIIWIFNGSVNGFTIPKILFISGFLLCLSLSIDVLQYICTTAIWYFYYLRQRSLHAYCDEDNATVQEPEWYNIVSWILFCLKIVIMIAAYILIGWFLISNF